MQRRMRLFPLLDETRQRRISNRVQERTAAWEQGVKLGLWAGCTVMMFGIGLDFASETPPLDHLATDVFNVNVVEHGDRVAFVGIGELVLDGMAYGGLRLSQSVMREAEARRLMRQTHDAIESLN